MIVTEEIPDALGGQRLDRIVALLGGVSRSVVVGLLDGGFVELDGHPATNGKLKLAVGQTISIDLGGVPAPVLPQAEAGIAFAVVHEDDDIVVIDKPPGLVVHPAVGNEHGTLVNGLLQRYPEIAEVGEADRPGIVHRLDAGTSGLLVVARSAAAHATLSQRMAAHEVERVYDALVWGHPSAAQGVIDAPIGRKPSDPLRMAVVVSGKSARTHFAVVGTYTEPAAVARVRCTLETGRTHQIRVHLAAIDHPVVGDPLYGQRRNLTLVERPFLHAARLAFDHPLSGEPLEFEAPLPDDLTLALSRLR